jgi:hypothetical protein
MWHRTSELRAFVNTEMNFWFTHLPDDEGNKLLWNFGQYLEVHAATSKKTAIFMLVVARFWNVT